MTKRSFSILTLCLIGLIYCATTLTASMTASLNAGTNTVIANVNFTSFYQPAGPDGDNSKLRLRFINPEGDQLDFVLEGDSSAFYQPGRYDLDGNTNTFQASFTVVTDQGPQVIDVTTENGYLDATVFNVSDGFVTDLQGTFNVSFRETSGNAEGSVAYTQGAE